MTDDYREERNMNLNENYSWTMSSSRFSVNKKRHKTITSYKFSVLQNAVIGNVAINIYGDRNPLG